MSYASVPSVSRRDERYYLSGGFARETFDRRIGLANLAGVLTSGQMLCSALVLYAGDVIATVAAESGTTAAATVTNIWMCLYDTAGALAVTSTEQGASGWVASTVKTFPLPYTVPTSGVYYLGLLVAATTVPTIRGSNLTASATNTVIPNGKQVSGFHATTGLTNPASAPATLGSISNSSNLLYAVAY